MKAVFLIGFGGPTSPVEVEPFFDSVLEGVQIPPERRREVLCHYKAIGGRSPYNQQVFGLRDALADWLRKRDLLLWVFVGFRHSKPSLKDALWDAKHRGIREMVGFVLSPLRSYASFGRYVKKVTEAQEEALAGDIEIRYAAPFHHDRHFIQIQKAKIEEALGQASDISKTYFIFSAHSIPTEMAEESGYDRQFEEMAQLVAGELGLENWRVAYQSRSGHPGEPWLGPSVGEVIAEVNPKKFERVVVVPAGFLCENVEILYGLDIEAKSIAQSRGLKFFRAKTVMEDPRFVELVGRYAEKEAEGAAWVQ